MAYIQLELRFEQKTDEELSYNHLQNQISNNKASMGKIQRKVFQELGEIKKENTRINWELAELKKTLNELIGKKTEYHYFQDDFLFLTKG